MALDEQCLRNAATPADLPFDVRKIGHVVLPASDLARSVAFYTRVLGFRVSDVYPEDMMPGGMVFMRCNADDHGVPITFEGRRRAGVQIAVEFRDPDRYWLEIYWGLDQVGPDGAVRPKEQWDWTHTLEEAIDRPVPGQHAVLRDRSRRAREMTATQSALLGDYPVTRALKEGRVRSPRVALDFAPVATPASVFKRVVRGIDPQTGHHYDKTKRYIDAIDWLGAAERDKIFSANVEKVYPRLVSRAATREGGTRLCGDR